MSRLRALLALTGASRARIGLAVLLGALALAFGIGLMTSAGYLISRAAEHPPVLSLGVAIALVRLFGIGRPLLRYLDRLWSHDVALRALAAVRGRFYARVEPLAPGELDAFASGDLVSRMVGDVDALQGLYLRGVGPALVAVVVAAGAVAAAGVVLPLAGAILAAGLVLGGIAVPAATAALARSSARRQAASRGELTALLVELLRGAPELAVWGREEDALARVRAADARLARIARRDALAGGVGEGLAALVAGLTATAVLAAAVSAGSAGTLDRVLVAAVTLLALASFEAVAPLPGSARELAATLAAGGRILELVAREPAVRDPETPLPAPVPGAEVVLEGVTARYPGARRDALDRLDLRLAPGRRVALVGPSGAGKTTVTSLLLRFLDPSSGRVAIGGRDVRELRQADVRALFALAGQEAHLFDSTIRANLLLARPGASDEELLEALRRARLAELVASLPDGLDTLVGEEGRELSGGQRQRLVLARALLADAPYLLLDEPTAHLDPETARALVDDVLAATEGKGLLLVTHRDEGLDRMDEVVALGAP